MGQLSKTCPLTQLIHITFWWQKNTKFLKSGPQNRSGGAGKLMKIYET